MRKKLLRSLLIIGFSATTVAAVAQPAIPRKYVEHPGWAIGITFGVSDLWGDVGTQGIIDHYANERYYQKPHFMGGLMMRYTAHPVLGIRFNVNYGTLYATDEWNVTAAKKATSIEDDAYQRYLRNQDVRANVWEGAIMFELLPMRFNPESKIAQKAMQPYLMAGVGGFHFRPQTSLIHPVTGRKEWVWIKDLWLEGEGVEGTPGLISSLWQVCVPVGAGIRWDIGDNMGLGFEYMYRFTTTDRLDGVSTVYLTPDFYDRYRSPEEAEIAKQVYDKSWAVEPTVTNEPYSPRGNPEVLDGYSTFSITFIYKFTSNKTPWWY